jgi:hypothetical protein
MDTARAIAAGARGEAKRFGMSASLESQTTVPEHALIVRVPGTALLSRLTDVVDDEVDPLPSLD